MRTLNTAYILIPKMFLQEVKKIKIQFHDPLKALWTKHKPSYIALNKSLDDIFKENFFFDNLVSLDTNKSNNLKIRIPQAFISTVNRKFLCIFLFNNLRQK